MLKLKKITGQVKKKTRPSGRVIRINQNKLNMAMNPTETNTAIAVGIKQPPPVTILPIFLWRPDFVKGIPVALLIFRFALVTPMALFQENPPLFAKPIIPRQRF